MAQDLSRMSTEELLRLRQQRAQQQPVAPARPTTAIPYPTTRRLEDTETGSQTTFRDNVQAPNVQANTGETIVDTNIKSLDYQKALEARAQAEATRRKGMVAVDAGLEAIRGARQNIGATSTGTIGGLIGFPEGDQRNAEGTGLASLPILGEAIYGGTDKAALDANLQTVQSGLTYDFLGDIRRQAAAEGGSSAGIANTNLAEFLSLGTTQANVFGAQRAGADELAANLNVAEEQLLRRKAALLVPTSDLLKASPEERKAMLDAAYEQAKQEYLGGATGGGGSGGGGGGGRGPVLGPIGGPGTRIRSDNPVEPSIAKDEMRVVPNPALAGVDDTVRQMIRQGADASDIVSFMENRGVPITGELAATVQSNVEFYRPYAGRALPASVPEPAVNLERMYEPTTFGERLSGILADTAPGAFAIQTADGITLGGLDELLSGGDPQRMAELDFVKRYQQEAYPLSSLGGKLAGTAATFIPLGRGVNLGARLANLGTRGQAIATGTANVALGATEGALSTNEDRKTGAVTGGLFALGGDLAGRYIGGKVAGRFADEPTAAERTIADAVPDPARVQGVLSEAERVGSPVALADTSPALRNLAGASVRRSDDAGVLADGTVGARDLAQTTRAVETVERTLAKETNVPKAAKTLREQGQAAADPSYKAAYGRVGLAQDPEIKAILQRPDVQEGLKLAERAIANRGRNATELGFVVGKNGRVTLKPGATFEALDLAKRGIDDHLDSFRDDFGRLVTNDQTRAIIDAREALVTRMRALNPDYAAALDTYAPFAANAEALEMGGKAITAGKATPAQIGEIVGQMTPEQLANYQIGAANAIIDRVKKAKDNTDAFSVFRSEDMRQRLAAVFPDKADQLANLNSVTQLEGLMRRTKEALLGGSATAGRQVADEAFGAQTSALGPLAEGGLSFATGGTSTVLQSLVRLGTLSGRNAQRLAAVRDQEALAADLAPILLETDPAKARKALDGILGKVDRYNKVRATSRGVGASAGAATTGVLTE